MVTLVEDKGNMKGATGTLFSFNVCEQKTLIPVRSEEQSLPLVSKVSEI